MVTRRRVAELSGIDVKIMEKVLVPIENAWAVTDHAKCLCFMLSEGVVPSNVQAGYLARLLFRRVYRLMRSLNMNPDQFYDIIDMQVNYWQKDFPQFKTMQKEIIEMLKVEEEKFKDTIARGEGMVKRLSVDLKLAAKNNYPTRSSQNFMILMVCLQKLLNKRQKKKVCKSMFQKTFTRLLLNVTCNP
jgi:alanyl-tRNA synthetase